MPEDINRYIFPSNYFVNHDLTMLYLKQQDLSDLSISELAQKYTDINKSFFEAFKEQTNK